MRAEIYRDNIYRYWSIYTSRFGSF